MNTKRKAVYTFWVVVTAIPIAGLIWSVLNPTDFRAWQETARNLTSRFGYAGPVAFVLVQALQVIITPISHYTVGAIGGYLYGPWIGGLLNYVGRILGHLCAFTLARRYGRPLIAKYLDEDTVKKYDSIFAGSDSGWTLQTLILFLIYFLPLFPDDEISYLVGASNMPKRSFFLANVFGHLGGAFSLAYLGSGIDTREPIFWVLTILTLVGFPIIWVFFRLHTKRE